MKNILLLLCFLFFIPDPAIALSPSLFQQISSGDCDPYDCSGTGSFLWECTSTTVAAVGFCPLGCSDGDTSMSGNGTISITAGIASFSGANAYYTATVSADDIYDDTLGTVFIKFKITTWVNDVQLWKVYEDAQNKINISLTSDNDLYAWYEGNNIPDSLTHTGNKISTGIWYILRYRWKTGEAGDDHQLTLYSAAMAELEDLTENDGLTSWANAPGAEDYIVGNNTATAGAVFEISYVHTYIEWVDDDQ